MTKHDIAAYVGARLDCSFSEPFEALCTVRDGRLMAGAVFTGYTGANIDVTIAGEPGAYWRPLLRGMADYVFRQLGCTRMSAMTEQRKVAKMCLRLGAQTEGRLRDYYGVGRDAIVLGFLSREQRLDAKPIPAPRS